MIIVPTYLPGKANYGYTLPPIYTHHPGTSQLAAVLSFRGRKGKGLRLTSGTHDWVPSIRRLPGILSQWRAPRPVDLFAASVPPPLHVCLRTVYMGPGGCRIHNNM